MPPEDNHPFYSRRSNCRVTCELTSLDAATRAVCALSALVWILSVVLVVTTPSDRSMSAEIALIWVAASPDVAVSERCASRALLRIEAAVSAGVAVIVQPGGSVRDAENIAKADELGVAMLFTGERHFLH